MLDCDSFVSCARCLNTVAPSLSRISALSDGLVQVLLLLVPNSVMVLVIDSVLHLCYDLVKKIPA